LCYTRIVLTIRKLLWDSWNSKHIARHHITPEEVETVCHNDPLVLRGQQKSRLVVIGQTEDNQIITIILESQGSGKYYPITAYGASTNDRTLYNRLKGGENNENE
jgi:uncharacterized DUF497 family protein